jgi:hypothetical protein
VGAERDRIEAMQRFFDDISFIFRPYFLFDRTISCAPASPARFAPLSRSGCFSQHTLSSNTDPVAVKMYRPRIRISISLAQEVSRSAGQQVSRSAGNCNRKQRTRKGREPLIGDRGRIGSPERDCVHQPAVGP